MRLAAALLLCAACGGGRTEWPGDPELYGVDLVPRDHVAAVKHVLVGSAAWWGLLPAEAFSGLRVVLAGIDDVPCAGGRYLGCFDESSNIVSVGLVDLVPCIEQTILAHELLHYTLYVARGDSDSHHADPLWDSLGLLMLKLEGEAGCAP